MTVLLGAAGGVSEHGTSKLGFCFGAQYGAGTDVA